MYSFTIILIVALGAIFVIFSEDFLAFFKKLLKIKWVALLIPLTVMSLLVVILDSEILLGLLYIKWGLTTAIFYACKALPFKACTGFLMPILIIFLLTMSPVYLIKKIKERKMARPFNYGDITALMLWLFFSILYVVSIYDYAN